MPTPEELKTFRLLDNRLVDLSDQLHHAEESGDNEAYV